MEFLEQDIERNITRLVQEKNLEIVELNFYKSQNDYVIRLLVDKDKGGITVEECSLIHKTILRFLEEKQFRDGRYSLEVSSPGLDRPLKTKKDFLRVCSREVVCYLSENIEGKKEHQGRIQNVFEDVLEVQTKSGLVAIPFKIINKAVQII
ncbi:MAG TPA: hypothetical protein PLH56_04615 [Candidatus Omnitrophota bacterium]|nr:hypothetical protein [Candidatus Omnitrophota bacterium]